jgi:hypothetical protein
MKRCMLVMSAAAMLLWTAMAWSGWLPFGIAEPHGLELRVCRKVPYEPFEPRPFYFAWRGFTFGNGWIGGMQAGRGQFLLFYWALVIPYWFCASEASVLGCVVIWRMRRRVRRFTRDS